MLAIKATILAKYKEGGSTHTVKNNLGKTCFQRCKCNGNGKTFRPSFEKKAYQSGAKEQVLAMRVNGLGTLDITRVLRSDKNPVSAVSRKNRDGRFVRNPPETRLFCWVVGRRVGTGARQGFCVLGQATSRPVS